MQRPSTYITPTPTRHRKLQKKIQKITFKSAGPRMPRTRYIPLRFGRVNLLGAACVARGVPSWTAARTASPFAPSPLSGALSLAPQSVWPRGGCRRMLRWKEDVCGDIRRDERSVSSFCSVACRFNRLSDWEGVFVGICSFEGGNGGLGCVVGVLIVLFSVGIFCGFVQYDEMWTEFFM